MEFHGSLEYVQYKVGIMQGFDNTTELKSRKHNKAISGPGSEKWKLEVNHKMNVGTNKADRDKWKEEIKHKTHVDTNNAELMERIEYESCKELKEYNLSMQWLIQEVSNVVCNTAGPIQIDNVFTESIISDAMSIVNLKSISDSEK